MNRARARRRPAFVVAGVLAAMAAAVATGDSPAVAAGATVTETGWWSRSPGTATPDGGFQVAKAVDGDLSVAAIRITIEGRLTKALLVLKEAPGGFRSDAAKIAACPTSAPWTAASPGAFDDAPEPDCSRTVELARNATTSTWTADVLPLLGDATGTASLVLAPGDAAGALPLDPGFTVEFSAAQLDAEGTDVAAGPDPSAPSSSGGGGSGTIASDTGGGGQPASSATGSGPGPSASFSPTFAPVDTFASTSSPASVTPTPGALPSASPEVATGGAGGAGTAASVESGLQPVAAPATRGERPPWGRLLVLVPLSIAAGAAGARARRFASGRSVGVATAG